NPGVGLGYRPQLRRASYQQLTEMGGYIGQFSAADVWSYRGPACDNSHYMFFDINYAQSGNYGNGVAPNTKWSVDDSTGQSVKTWIGTAGNTNTTDSHLGPSSPSNFTMTNQEPNAASCSWSAVNGAASYNLYRASVSSNGAVGGYAKIGNTTALTYRDSTATNITTPGFGPQPYVPATVYRYAVSALSS